VAAKILPNSGNPKHTLKGRLKGTVTGFAGAVAWLIAAGVLPYETLTPYWPEAGRWGPVILFALAAFNLLKGLYNLAWAARLFSSKPPRLAAPFRERGRTGTSAAEAGRNRNDQDSNDRARNKPRVTMTPAKTAPTVQRMR
jgi:hypothetical protein